jgi:multidrug efflux system outer membrane protein
MGRSMDLRLVRRLRAVVTTIVVVAGTAGLGAQSRGALTLEAAITEALQHSPELQPGEDAVKLASVRTRLAASAFGVKVAPTLSANSDPILGSTREAGVSVTKQLQTGAQAFATVSSYQFGTSSSAAQRDASYTVGISQPLLRGFTRTAMADVTNATRAAVGADRDLSIARAGLVVHVAAQYFAVVKQQRLSEAARQAADRATALRVASEARTRVGLATELDVLRSEVLESQMGASVASAAGALAAAQDQLALLLGRRLGEPIEVVTATDGREQANVEDISSSVDDLTRTALATRVEVREAHDRVGDAARAAEVAHWNLLPPIALDVSYTRRNLTSSIGFASGLATSGWKVGVCTAYALDRSAELASAETARISVDAARRTVAETEQRVAAEVRQTYRAWQTAGTTVTIQQRGLDLAQRELRLAELRFERGLASSLDVIDAENSVLQAQNALIAAELDRTVLALDLRRATGVLEIGQVFQ